MPVRAPSFELGRFEYVDAGRGSVLLRVSGRWHAQRPGRLSDVRLVVDDGRSRRRIAALPGPDEAGRAAGAEGVPWRAAFAVPAALLAGDAPAFSLETAHFAVALPAPGVASPRVSRESATPERRAASRSEAHRRGTEEERAHAARRRREAMAVLEERVDAERRARAEAEHDALAAREELARLRAEVRAARRAGDERAQMLGERVARLERERAEADVAMRAARAQIAVARAELEERLSAERAARGELRAASHEAREQAQSARADASTLSRELAEAQAHAEEVEAGRAAAEARAREHALARREAQAAAAAAHEAREVFAARAAAAEKVVETAHLVERERDRAVIAARAAADRAAGATARMRALEREMDEARSRAETAERAQRRLPELKERLAELERARVQLAAKADQVPALEHALEVQRDEARALAARVAALEQERDLAARATREARAELASAREQAQRDGAGARTARQALQEDADAAAAKAGELEQVLAARERALAEASAARDRAEASIARLRDEARAAREALARGEEEARALAASVAALEQERDAATQTTREARAQLAAAQAAAEQAARKAERECGQALTAARRATKRADKEAGRARGLQRELAEERARARSRPAPRTTPQAVTEPARRRLALVAHAAAQRVRGLRAARAAAGERAEPASDRRARVFVWTCFALVLGTSAFLVLSAGRNIPIQEDWHVIAAATGNEAGFWGWVWEPNNEHRVPIAKLLYVALFQLWPDFRVGMVFNLAALAGIAAAFVVFLRRLRGHTRWSDAFFPLIFLHLGNWENFGWSWQLTFVIAAGVAAAMLMLIALPGPWTTRRAALLVACMLVTPFTGATALPFAAAVAVALLVGWRNLAGRPRTVLATGAALTLALSALYFVDLPKSTWVPPSPGPLTDLLTSGKFLALGLGPAAGRWWLLSVVAVCAALASAAWLLWRARHRGGLALLAFLGAGVVLAVSLGRGRAGAVPYFGLPDRYVLVAIPLICAIYLVWDRFGDARSRRFGPALLCGAMLLLLPLNTVYGAQWKDWYQDRVDTFGADVAQGVPLAELIRYRPLGWDPQEMWMGMQYLRVRKVGVFENVRLIPPPRRAWAIDGFASGGGGWETLRGKESRARLVTRHGQREMRWKYEATRRAPAVLGRRFDTPADWRGSGALAFTVAGQATQRRVRVRITLQTPGGPLERFDTWFTDTTSDTRTVVMPWNGFGRANARGVFVDVLKGPLPLTGIRSVTFIIGDRGPGVLRIKRLALTPGHPQLGWPLHAATERRSLPPLQ